MVAMRLVIISMVIALGALMLSEILERQATKRIGRGLKSGNGT